MSAELEITLGPNSDYLHIKALTPGRGAGQDLILHLCAIFSSTGLIVRNRIDGDEAEIITERQAHSLIQIPAKGAFGPIPKEVQAAFYAPPADPVGDCAKRVEAEMAKEAQKE